MHRISTGLFFKKERGGIHIFKMKFANGIFSSQNFLVEKLPKLRCFYLVIGNKDVKDFTFILTTLFEDN